MLDHHIVTYYMNHRLDVPPRVAVAAFDELARQDNWTVHAPGARLKLTRPLPTMIGSGYAPLRATRGVLMVGYHRVPVELELLPWSADRTELGLRPLCRRPSQLPSERVLRAGHRTLDHVDQLLTEWVEQSTWLALAEARHDPRVRDGRRVAYHAL